MATATVRLDTRRVLKKRKNEYPVKVDVYLTSKSRFEMACKLSATERDYAAATHNGNKTKKQKELKKQLDEIQKQAQKILDDASEITPSMFKRMFNAQQNIYNTKYRTRLEEIYDRQIDKYGGRDAGGTAQNYVSSLVALEEFRKDPKGGLGRKEPLDLENITEELIEKWEAYITETKGNSRETFNTYCRWLRAVVNVAVKIGLLHKDRNPFGKGKLVIGSTTSAKTALSEDDLLKLRDFKTKYEGQQRARDIWMFCYMCNGISPIDLSHLKRENIKGNYIFWTRIKTEKRKKGVVYTQAFLQPEMRQIIKRWGGDDKVYLFNIRSSEADKKTNDKRFKTWRRNTHRTLERIAELTSIQKINLSANRHTFATILTNKGIPTTQLRDMMNHSSSQTTEIYQGTLPTEDLRKYSNQLLDFKKRRWVPVEVDGGTVTLDDDEDWGVGPDGAFYSRPK